MVLEALNSQVFNSTSMGQSPHEAGFAEMLHFPAERTAGMSFLQMLDGIAVNRDGGIRSFADDIEEKLAAPEQLEIKEQRPWQHGFQQLLNFPLCHQIDDSAFMIPPQFPDQHATQYVSKKGTGSVENTSSHDFQQARICHHQQLFEPESCITHVSESCSPIKTEACKDHSSSEILEEGVSSAALDPNSCITTNSSSENGTGGGFVTSSMMPSSTAPSSQLSTRMEVRDRRKRKRSKACKNSEEVESQRMTHIAVERNRRKQMNEHLSVLRSLMPGSYIQRGDQASIIGGAIDFVKELEQLLQSLQAQKRKRECEEFGCSPNSPTPFNGFFLSPQYTSYSAQWNARYGMENTSFNDTGSELIAENKSAVADIEVTMIETHASIKILSQKRTGQLMKTIEALQSLHMTILHLNITTIDQTVLYSFNVKIEDECQLTSADEIATAVHDIFNIIHSNAIN